MVFVNCEKPTMLWIRLTWWIIDQCHPATPSFRKRKIGEFNKGATVVPTLVPTVSGRSRALDKDLGVVLSGRRLQREPRCYKPDLVQQTGQLSATWFTWQPGFVSWKLLEWMLSDLKGCLLDFVFEAADLFFGILIVVSAILLGQELMSCGIQWKIKIASFASAVVSMLRSWYWIEPSANRYLERCILLDSVVDSEFSVTEEHGMQNALLLYWKLWSESESVQRWSMWQWLIEPCVWEDRNRLKILKLIVLAVFEVRRFGFLVMFVVELMMRAAASENYSWNLQPFRPCVTRNMYSK